MVEVEVWFAEVLRSPVPVQVCPIPAFAERGIEVFDPILIPIGPGGNNLLEIGVLTGAQEGLGVELERKVG